MGENVALGALKRGCTGALINGGTRDRAALQAMNFPVFARYVTPVRAHGRYAVESVDMPLSLPSQSGSSVAIAPGDYLLGDDDGAVIVPKDCLDVVLRAGEHVEQIERAIRKGLLAGEDREHLDCGLDKWAVLRELGFLPEKSPPRR